MTTPTPDIPRQPGFSTSGDTSALDEALSKAQAEIDKALKDKTNPHFRSKYADLAAVWEACRDALAKQKVHVTQWPIHSEDGRLHLITRLSHAGQWMQGHFSLPVEKQNAHGYGSAVTYARRFALSAAVGVVPDEDDDGNASTQKGGQKQGKKQQPKKPANGEDKATVLHDCKVMLNVMGASAEERAAMAEDAFGVKTWADVEALSLGELAAGRDKLKEKRQERASREPGWMEGKESAS